MKKTILLFVVLAYTSTVMLAGTVDDPGKSSDAAVMIGSNGQVKVFYSGNDVNTVTISIYDEDNNLKFTEKIKGRNQFVRPYNLSELAKGDYRIVVHDKQTTISKPYSNYKKTNLTAHIQKIKQSESSFLLTVSDPAAEEVQIDVVNENGKVLMSHKLNGKGQFAQLYRLKKLAGEVYFKVSSDSGTVMAEK
jgi:flagellar hook assembly protein FlgD